MADKREYEEPGQSAWKGRQAFLLRFSDTLRAYNNQDDIGKAAMKMLAKELDLDRCYCAMIELTKDRAQVMYQSGNSLIPPIPDTLSLSNFSELLLQANEGPLTINNVGIDNRLTAVDRASFAAISFHAVAACTIRRGKKHPVWSLVAVQSVPRKWTEVEIMLLEEAAERLYSAIENTRALTALAESEKKYRTLFNSIDECFCIIQMIFDESGKPVDYLILEANPALYELTGLTDAIGKRMRDLVPGHEQFWYDKYGEIALTGKPARFQHRADALGRWYDVYAFPIDKPQELKLAVLFKDITERKDEEKRQVEEERLKTYLLLQKSEETALLGSWEFNRLNGHFTWSDGMYRLFDLKKGTQVIPAIYLAHTNEKSLAKAERVVQYILNSDSDFEETLEMNISGKIKVLRIKGTPIRNNQGDIEHILGVDQDISAMWAAEDKIKKMEQEQQLKIFRTSLSTLEEERHRISESLHNGIGQLLYGIKINMSRFRTGASDEELRHNKAYINELLSQAIIETRRVSHELMPTTLEQFGLKSAIDDICRQLSGAIVFNCHISIQHNRLEKYMELAVYRTAQELMTNVVKHAKATTCDVTIIIGTDQVKIAVNDNGRGMTEEADKVDGIGLASIRSKIELLDGKLTIASNSGKGTHVEVLIPHQGLTNKHSRL
ncbi:PAS domain S-box-containing protein [Pedobacter terrae]|uniref:Oxygen sensor histidine kinase NreB n=1 Tax=Pedobacter terrae TaxID=405671 RepID=A0A1G8B0M3_9SPHI|nr:ATP-binding protein [Pedobacter terrae]SDH26822.1 PAS domain S-box-containing protein [Pedobacter terrae]